VQEIHPAPALIVRFRSTHDIRKDLKYCLVKMNA
jgi:hypothetical protein